MTSRKSGKTAEAVDAQDMVEAMDRANKAVSEFRAKHPDADVDRILAGHGELRSTLAAARSGELGRYIDHAKEQGTKIPFRELEAGVLEAGRRDMRDGLAEVMDSIRFDAPVDAESGEKMANHGRAKKNS